MTSRKEVYDAIDTEREYQNALGPDRTENHGEGHSVGDYITMLQAYQTKLVSAWTDSPGDILALHVMRKIAGIAVRCMEDHGALKR